MVRVVPVKSGGMAASVVFTLVGPDRPGLVEKIATCVTEAGANWDESQLAHLGGQFAGIVRVHVDRDSIAQLRQRLTALEGLDVTVAEDRDGPDEARRSVRLELLGVDRPGIVREIGQTLAALRVNFEELATSTESAPMTGKLLFRAVARIHIPESLPVAEVRTALERLADELMVDLHLDELD